MDATKEAVVFILDSNHSMNARYPPPSYTPKKHVSTGVSETTSVKPEPQLPSEVEGLLWPGPTAGTGTRLSCCKEAILESVIDLAWRSNCNEIGLVVLKTHATHHHLSTLDIPYDDDVCGLFNKIKAEDNEIDTASIKNDNSHEPACSPFPNMIELNMGINRPNPRLLREIKSIQSTSTLSSSVSMQGDFSNGIILAADSLYRRTFGKKYRRRLVLITDAEHKVQIDAAQLNCVITGLQKLDCSLTVIGFGFETERYFIPSKSREDEHTANKNGRADCKHEFHDQPDEAKNFPFVDVNDENSMQLLIKRENEKFLLSLVEQIGGCVMAANGEHLINIFFASSSAIVPNSCLSSLMARVIKTSQKTKSVRKQFEFRIAPNLIIPASYSLLIYPKSLPSLKRAAYQLDPHTGKPLRDGNKEVMTSPICTVTTHWDSDRPEIEVSQENRTDAYQYGCDLIPVGEMDIMGIKAAFASPRCLDVIGYISKFEVDPGLFMGPVYAILGGRESKKSRAAIAALAESMDELDMYGLCRFVKTENADPIIGALIPQLASDIHQSGLGTDTSGGRFLAFLQLPFADDVRNISSPSLELKDIVGNNKEVNACDDLIDSLMLPDNQLQSADISSPTIKPYRCMVAQFAMNPPAEDELQGSALRNRVQSAARPSPLFELPIIKEMTEKSSKQINAFVQAFPLVENRLFKDNTRNIRQDRKYWGDGL